MTPAKAKAAPKAAKPGGAETIDVRALAAQPTVDHDLAAADAPLCMTCGIHMQRAGSCYVCPDCGTTSGCS